MKTIIFALILAIFCIENSLQSSGGAPALACADLAPRHGLNQPQAGSPPIEIFVQSGVPSGSFIPVTIRTTSGNFLFRGFKIQARTLTGEIIGTFEANAETNLVTCSGRQGAGATQTSNAPKTEVTFLWQAPEVSQNLAFNFVYSIVETFSVFWVDQRSDLNTVLTN